MKCRLCVWDGFIMHIVLLSSFFSSLALTLYAIVLSVCFSSFHHEQDVFTLPHKNEEEMLRRIKAVFFLFFISLPIIVNDKMGCLS